MNVERTLPKGQAMGWAHNALLDPIALSFSRHVAAEIDLSKASFRVLAEQSLSDAVLMDFATGGKISGEPHPQDWLLECIAPACTTLDDCILAEDWLARPEHTFLVDRAMPAVISDQEVYYIVPADELRVEPNWRRIFANTVPSFHAFVIDGNCTLFRGDTFTIDAMQLLAKQVRKIIFGVYDGESYMVCSLSK